MAFLLPVQMDGRTDADLGPLKATAHSGAGWAEPPTTLTVSFRVKLQHCSARKILSVGINAVCTVIISIIERITADIVSQKYYAQYTERLLRLTY